MSALTPASRPRHPADFPHSAPVTAERATIISGPFSIAGTDVVVVGFNPRRVHVTVFWMSGATVWFNFGQTAVAQGCPWVNASGGGQRQDFDIRDFGRWIQGDIHMVESGGATTAIVIETIIP